MRLRPRLLFALPLLLGVVFATVPVTAELYVVPSDTELIAQSQAIVVGTVTGLNGAFAENGDIVTNIDIDVDAVLKGNVDHGTIRLVEQGGIVGGKIMVVSAAPQYWAGNRALIFLTKSAAGNWETYGAALGKFDFVTDSDKRPLLVRWLGRNDAVSTWSADGHPHEEKLRHADLFLRYIAAFLQASPPYVPGHPDDQPERPPVPDYFVDAPAPPLSSPFAWDPKTNAVYPPSAYTQGGNFRWDTFETGGFATFMVSGTYPGYDYIGAAQRGLAAWTNDAGSNVDYRYGGTSTAKFLEDGQNTIVYNSATDVPAGAIAYAKWYAGVEHIYKGETFYAITEGDVVVKSGLNITQTTFDEAVTHELGHTLGFRHSDAGTPSSTDAVMKAVLNGTFGANLRSWDIEAVRTVYETGVTSTYPNGGGPLPTPQNLIATATSTTTVTITWGAVTGATGYRLERSSGAGTFTQIATPTGTSYNDTGLTPGTTYVYRVRAVKSASISAYSNVDHATTILFTDDPLVPRVTVIKAVHITQLRSAVNAMRVAAGLGTVTWTDPSLAGVRIKAVHITELRNALTPALTALGKSAAYTDPSLTAGIPVKAVHVQELRNYTK